MRSSPFAPDPRAPDPRGPDPLDPGPAGFAHRGLHCPRVPENSLAAFAGALDFGAGIECDLRLSADGTAMVFHDRGLERLCGAPLDFEASHDLALGGLRLLGSEERIPSLVELLDLARGAAPLLLELKTLGDNARRLAASVAADLDDYPGPIGVMSFDPRVGAWLARARPRVRRGLVLSGRDPAPARWWKIHHARPQFLAVKISEVARPWVRRAHASLPVYAWTIRSATERKTAAVHANASIWEANGRP